MNAGTPSGEAERGDTNPHTTHIAEPRPALAGRGSNSITAMPLAARGKATNNATNPYPKSAVRDKPPPCRGKTE